MELSHTQRSLIATSFQPGVRDLYAFGPVRCGKTYSATRGMLLRASRNAGCFYAFAAKTQKQFESVILTEVRSWLREIGLGGDWLRRAGQLYRIPGIGGRFNYLVPVIMAEGAVAVERIQGLTLAGAYVDEAQNAHPDLVTMLSTRASETGGLIIWTGNPKGPNHPLKRERIDACDGKRSISIPFKITDNPRLDPEYIAHLDRVLVPGSAKWRRLFKGEWVPEAGAVWPEAVHSEETPWPHDAPDIRFVAIDHASSSVTHALLMQRYSAGRIFVSHELRLDHATQGPKSDHRQAREIIEWASPLGATRSGPWIVDPAAASLSVALRDNGTNRPVPARNDVLDGIQAVAHKFATGRLVIANRCAHLLGEIGGYEWDTTAAEKGEDKPVKAHDHGPDALRYGVATIRQMESRGDIEPHPDDRIRSVNPRERERREVLAKWGM